MFKKEFAQQADSHIDADERIQDTAIEILDRWNQMDKTKKVCPQTATTHRLPRPVTYKRREGLAQSKPLAGNLPLRAVCDRADREMGPEL